MPSTKNSSQRSSTKTGASSPKSNEKSLGSKDPSEASKKLREQKIGNTEQNSTDALKKETSNQKHCPTCNEDKPLDEFYNHRAFKDGKKKQCKDCENEFSRKRYADLKASGHISIKNRPEKNREGYLKRTFGITSEQYDELLEKQNGCCAICERHHTEFNKRLAVDHAHTESVDIPAGMVRGLLCFHCNHLVVGRHTNAKIFENAAKYLRSHTGWKVPDDKVKPKRKYRRRIRK